MALFENTRRDLLILLLGCLGFAAAILFHLQRHPASYLQSTIEREQVALKVDTLLADLGYAQLERAGQPRFTFRQRLSRHIQEQSGFLSTSTDERRDAFDPVYHWSQLLVDATRPDSTSIYLDPDGLNAPRMAVELDQFGLLVAFRNPDQIVPNPPSPARISSLIPVPASNQPSAPGGVESDPIVDARTIADTLLAGTGWAQTPLTERENARTPVTYASVGGVSMVLDAPDPVPGVTLSIRVDFTADGRLLSLLPEYTYDDTRAEENRITWIGIRGGLTILFLLWLLYVLYLRIKERVIDVKSSILFAVLIGFTFPLLNLSELYALVQAGELDLRGADVLIQFVNLSISTAIVSVAFFIASAIGESIARQTWSEKLQTLDFIRMGALSSRPVGWMMIRSVMFAGALLGFTATAAAQIPGLALTLPEALYSHQYFLAFFALPLEIILVTLILTQAIFLVVLNTLKARIRRPWVLLAAAGLIYAVMNPTLLHIEPRGAQFAVNLVIGAALGAIYVRWDFLNVLLTQFLFMFGQAALQGLVMPGTDDVWIWVNFLSIAGVLLLAGTVIAMNGKDPSEVERYEPDYIEDLAVEQRMRQELAIAKQVQESFLPVRLPEFDGADLYARCRSAYETGGDYYDFIPLQDSRLGVIIGDVSGKGIQAAFFMTFIKGVMHALADSHSSTQEVLLRANTHFSHNAPRGTFITMIYGVIDLKAGEFRFTRAGHNPVLVLRKGAEHAEEFRSSGIGIGLGNRAEFERSSHEMTLPVASGDLLVLYTDGIVEAKNSKGDEFGLDRLKRHVEAFAEQNARELTARLFEEVEAFSGAEGQHDDMTMLVIRIP